MESRPQEPAVYSLFRDDEGEPELQPSAVLFLDLLGTASPRSEQEAQQHLEITHRALANARR